MKKLKIYLDTSVINFLFADDSPDFKKVTEDFFNNYVKLGKYEVFISEVVLREIENTPVASKRFKLLQIVKQYHLAILPLTDEAITLSENYLKQKVIPAKKIEDAQHIAIATCNHIDILLSWNFKHLANVNKQQLIKNLNEREGYFYPMSLITPIEVIYEQE